jgi:hypothetical protein
MAEDYEFVTVWRFDAPLAEVWAPIKDSEKWSDWWKGVLEVEKLKDGDPHGVGAIHRSTWKSVLPYKLVFDSETVRVEEQKLIEVRDWRVKTTKSWMNFLAPLAKPFFRWNHDTIMNWGGAGLAKKLNCKLLESR